MTTFHSNQISRPPQAEHGRMYVGIFCAQCDRGHFGETVETRSIETEHGVLIGTGRCNYCNSIQPMLMRVVADARELHGTVERLAQ